MADLARHTSAARKDALPWWKMATFGAKRTRPKIVNGQQVGGASLRHDDNVTAIFGIEADYDAGAVSVDQALERLEKAGLAALVYTSPSHTDDAPRWRIMAPTSSGYDPPKRRHWMGRLNGLFRGSFARESWTLSQGFYYGSINSNPAHRVEVVDGFCIDHLDELDEAWQGPPGSKASAVDYGGVSLETREDAELIRAAIEGDDFHVALCALAGRYIGRSLPAETVTSLLRGIMLSHHEQARDARWGDRYADIGNLVASAIAKFGDNAAGRRAVAREAHKLLRNGAEAQQALARLQDVALTHSVPWTIAERIATAIFAKGA
jgi:hypothetical protein